MWLADTFEPSKWEFYFQSLPRFVVAGVLQGLILAVIALAFVLIYRTTEIVNFGQGDFMAISIFSMLVISDFLGPKTGAFGAAEPGILPLFWAWAAAAVLTILLMVIVSVVFDLAIFRSLTGQSPLAVVIVTIALGFIIRNALDVIVKPSAAASVKFPLPQRYSFDLGIVNINIAQIAVLVCVPLLLWGMVAFLNRTKVGLAAVMVIPSGGV